MIRSQDRVARVAGGVVAGVVGVLAVWLTVLAVTDNSSPDEGRSQQRVISEVTLVAVGLSVCVVGVLLLLDRFTHRLGAVVLTAGSLWLIPPALSDLAFAAGGGDRGGAGSAAAALCLNALAMGCRCVTVLLLPLILTHSSSVWWRGLAAVVCVWYLGSQVLWVLGTPGTYPFISPWVDTGVSRWAREVTDCGEPARVWASEVVPVVVTAGLCASALKARARRERRLLTLLAVTYPLCVVLLLTEWDVDTTVMATQLAGVVLWVTTICLSATRGGLWRLDRASAHRLAAAFTATLTGAMLLATVVLLWTGRLGWHNRPHMVAGCALLVGWAARPLVRWVTLRVERIFYGARARPHEAVHALAARLRQAPNPSEVPEQICRSAVEDLGLSGAEVSVDTRTGSRRLARAGADLTGPVQHFPLEHHGRPAGRLTVARDPSSTPVDRDSDLLALLAGQAAPALAALQLAEEAQAARERLVLAREEERRRLRREIHDGLGPRLAAVQLWIGTAQADGGLPRPAEQHLRTAAGQLGEALTEVRSITTGLAPAALVDRGLVGAVRDLARRLGTETTAVTVTVAPEPLGDLPVGVETAAYRIVSEALTNAVRHADARHIHIAVEADAAALTVVVSDDGHGFPAHHLPGTGLTSLAERAEEIGGSCQVTNTPAGVTVRADLPMPHGTPSLPLHDRGHPHLGDLSS